MRQILALLLAVSVSAADPTHLRPGQTFSVTAVVFGEVTATRLDVPPWLVVDGRTGGPMLYVYQVRVREGTPLGARGVVTFAADEVSASFMASVCCAEAQWPGMVRLPMIRR